MKKLLILPLVLFTLWNCTHKELCYDHPHISNVNVQFNWMEEPEKTPESMSVYFFEEGEEKPLRFEFTNKGGGRIRLTEGTYHAISVNSDVRTHILHDIEDFNSFRVSTKDASSIAGLSTFGITPNDLPRMKNTEDERIASAPEYLWHSNARDIYIHDRSEQDVQLELESQVVTYNIEVRNAANLKWVYGMSATISGMAGGFHPATGELSEEKVTIPFEVQMNKEESLITGCLTSFGHYPGDEYPHYLKVYAVLADNSWWDFTFDVTDQIHGAQDNETITILVEELPIPKPVANGGGFKPTVGEWNSIEIELKM